MTRSVAAEESLTATEAAARLSTLLERGRRVGRGVLLFVVYRAEAARAEAEALLVAQLQADAFAITRVYFPYGGDADWPAQFAGPPPDPSQVFFLYNLQREFPALLDQLNYRREFFAQAHVRAVFWVTEAELTALAEFAPDFFRFRTQVLELLAVPPPDQREAISHRWATSDEDAELGGTRAERETRIALLERLLAELGAQEPNTAARHALLRRLGNTYRDLGDARKSLVYHEQALAVDRALGNREGEASDLNNLGLAYAELGEPQRAIEYHQQALTIFREIGDRHNEGTALGNLGNAYYSLGEPQRAIDYYQQALTIFREIGDRRREGYALGNLGITYAHLGEPQRAIDYYQQALALARAIGDRRGEGNALGDLGNAYANQAELQRAIKYDQQALTIAREIGDRRGEGNALGHLGNAYAHLGEPQRAVQHFEQALAITREIGDRRGEANGSWNLGRLLEQQGDLEQAVPLMRVMVDYGRAIGHPDAERYAVWVEQVRERLAAASAEVPSRDSSTGGSTHPAEAATPAPE